MVDIDREAFPELQWQGVDSSLVWTLAIESDSDMLYPVLTKDTSCLDPRVSGVYYYHSDHLGSAAWVTHGAQAVQFVHYMPFGEMWYNQQGSAYNERYKFTGKERDEETGYDYFGARYYWQAGTWLSVDPLADENPGKSPYAYCSWNPISRIDPDGRADYYDGDGNHLCNDGVDDRKVYQQSDKGDVVLGGYATPFSYVGEVDKISLSYEGEMTSICKSKGDLTVTQYVGEKQFSKSFDAVSGSNGKKGPLYTLQNGDYICYDYIPNVSQEGYVKDGIGFKIRLRTDGWDTQRTDLQIHPDQYPPGTLGCIGLTGTASDLSLFQKMVSPFTSGGKTSPLSVSIIGNPQCCRAANYDKGLPALFCK